MLVPTVRKMTAKILTTCSNFCARFSLVEIISIRRMARRRFVFRLTRLALQNFKEKDEIQNKNEKGMHIRLTPSSDVLVLVQVLVPAKLE